MARRRPGAPQLAQPVTVGGSPGSGNGSIPATPGTPSTLTASLLQSYVSAGGYAYWANYARSLPHPQDDLTRDLGIEIYQSMQYDGVVKAALTVLAASVLEDSVNLSPAVDDDAAPDAALATQITDFCTWTLDNLTTPLDSVLWDMLMGAMATGSRVAEQTYKLEAITTAYVAGTPVPRQAQRLVLTDLKVKPHASTAFVVDAYNTTLGLLAVIPGVGWATLTNTTMLDLKAVPNILPREKFAVLSFRPVNGDPRGSSILRSAYQAWWHKMQMWPEYLKFLTQFASPLVVGNVAENAVDVVDPATNLLVTPEQAQLTALQGVRNGAALSQPFGATVQLHFSQGGGDAFVQAMDQDDRQITIAILSQTLATGEGRHNARAAAQVHMDILATTIKQMKKFVIRMIRRDILTPLVRYNFGDDAASRLVPDVSLGVIENADEAKVLAALATVPGFQLLPSQLQGTYDLVGLPQAEPDEIQALVESHAAGQQAATELALHPPEPAPAPAQSRPPPQGGANKAP